MSTRKGIARKRARLAEATDICRMSKAFELPETTIKLAIRGPEAPLETVTLYSTVSATLSALRKVKRFTLKRLIILQGMDLCETTYDLHKFESRLDALLGPGSLNNHCLEGEFESRVHCSIMKAINEVSTLRAAHSLWVRYANSQYEPQAHKKMLEIVTGTDLLLVIGLCYADNGVGAFSDDSWHINLLMRAAEEASPEMANKALLAMAKSEWAGEEESPIIPILIAKAAELYKK